MCLACDMIDEELAEQEPLDVQVKRTALHESVHPADPVTTNDEQHQ